MVKVWGGKLLGFTAFRVLWHLVGGLKFFIVGCCVLGDCCGIVCLGSGSDGSQNYGNFSRPRLGFLRALIPPS